MATASLRAPNGYHLPGAMSSIPNSSNLFVKFGGHPCAAGFSANAENLNIIKEQMTIELAKQGESLDLNKETFWDNSGLPVEVGNLGYRKEIIHFEQDEIDAELLQQIMSLDPFGQDFMFPNILFSLKSNTLNTKWIGQNQSHAKFTTQNGITCTAFNIEIDQKLKIQKPNSELWIVAKVSQNTWNNSTKLELIADKIIIVEKNS